MIIYKDLNSKGFSLIEMMAALAGSAILILVLSSALIMMDKSKRNVDASLDAAEFVSEVRTSMKNSAQCTATLAGKSYDTTVNNGSSLLSAQGSNFSLGSRSYQVGTNVGAGLSIKDIRLVKTNMKANAINVAGTAYFQQVANLVIELQKQNGIGPDPAPAYISVPVVTNGSAGVINITKCADVQTLQQTVCMDLNYYWDSATNSCLPTGKCTYAGSFSGAPGGYGFNNPVTNAQSCPAGFSQQVTGSVNVASSCGKTCVNNNSYPVYECVQCLNNVGQAIAMANATAPNISTNFDLDTDIDEAETDYGALGSGMQSALLASTSQTSFTCQSAGTVLYDATPGVPCATAMVSTSYPVCCGGTAQECQVTTSGWGGWLSVPSVTYATKIICN